MELGFPLFPQAGRILIATNPEGAASGMCLIVCCPRGGRSSSAGPVGDTKSKLRAVILAAGDYRRRPRLPRVYPEPCFQPGAVLLVFAQVLAQQVKMESWESSRAPQAGKIEGRTRMGLRMRWKRRRPEAGAARCSLGFAVLPSPSPWAKRCLNLFTFDV